MYTALAVAGGLVVYALLGRITHQCCRWYMDNVSHHPCCYSGIDCPWCVLIFGVFWPLGWASSILWFSVKYFMVFIFWIKLPDLSGIKRKWDERKMEPLNSMKGRLGNSAPKWGDLP